MLLRSFFYSAIYTHRRLTAMADSARFKSIVCVGSSFAAGPGITPVANVAAGRSKANFVQTTADLLASKQGGSRPTVTDLSVSGATLTQVLEERQKPNRPPSAQELQQSKEIGNTPVPGQIGSDGLFPPQITGVPTNADLILLTAGGNDVGYLSSAMRDSLMASGWFGWFLGLILGLIAPKPPLQPTDEKELTKRLATTVDALHARAPNARVLLVEYLALFPVPGSSPEEDEAAQRAIESTGLRREQISHYAGIAQMLSRAYATVAADSRRSQWCSVVAVDVKSRKEHALGSADPWVDGFSLSELMQFLGESGKGRIPLHPNKRGMDAVADMIVAHLAAS